MSGTTSPISVFTINKLTVPILIVLITYALSSCSSRHTHPDKSILRYNEAAGIVNLDPAFSRDQAHLWVCNHIYNSLVQLDDDLNVLPCIAKSWEISDDGKIYTFIIRSDVYFHHSDIFEHKTRKVVATDVAFSFQRLIDPETASPGAWVFGNVERLGDTLNIVVENDTTLSIKLSQAFPPFLGLLTMQYCSVIPYEAIDIFGKEFRKNPVGTGPFYLQHWEENIKMVLQKNENYFEKQGTDKLPYLDAVSISFLVDKMTAFLEFKQGNLDFISGIDPSYKDEILNRKGELRESYKDRFRLLSIPYLNTEYLGILVDTAMPHVKLSPLRLKAIRQAISYGFDRSKMIKYLRNGIGTPGTKGMIPVGMKAFSPVAGYGYDYNPAKSRELLKEAGFGTDKPVPPISLVTTSDYLDLCKFVQAQLLESGIAVEIEVAPPASVIERRAQSRVNFFRASWIADYPDEENYLSLFYSENFAPSGPNYTHFRNSSFDSLYLSAFGISKTSDRTRLYREMDSLVMEEAPVVVLYYDRALRFVQQNIEGMTANPINLLNLKKVKKTNELEY